VIDGHFVQDGHFCVLDGHVVSCQNGCTWEVWGRRRKYSEATAFTPLGVRSIPLRFGLGVEGFGFRV